MRILIRTFANLRDYAPEDAENGQWYAEIPEGSDIDELVELIGIPLSQRQSVIVTVNGKAGKGDDLLKHGDEAAIFPPLAGG